MSQNDHTLQDALEQHMGALNAAGDPASIRRDLLQWLLQEVLDLEFGQFLGVAPYPEGHWDGVNAARIGRAITRAVISGSFSPG